MRSVGWHPEFRWDGNGSILAKYATVNLGLQGVHEDNGGMFVSSGVWHLVCQS